MSFLSRLGTRWAVWLGSRPDPKFLEPGGYRVVLQVAGPAPVSVIRQVRLTTGLGLLEAKNLVESAPVVAAERISRESADLVADRLRSAGARAVAVPIEEM